MCICNERFSADIPTDLSLQSQLIFPQKEFVSVINLDTTVSLGHVHMGYCKRGSGGAEKITRQPEIIAKLIPITLFHVTEMRFSKKTIPKQFFHVIL